MKYTVGRLLMSALAVLVVTSSSSAISQIQTQLPIDQTPHYIYEDQSFELKFSVFIERPIPVQQSGYIVNGSNIVVFYEKSSLIFEPAVPPTHVSIIQSLSGLTSGEYNIYTQAYSGEVPVDYIIPEGQEHRGSVTIHPGTLSLELGLGSPKMNEVVGGIGLIRGWACYSRPVQEVGVPATIGTISYQIDNRTVKPVPLGSSRGDTSARCGGPTNNGFAATINWNRFSLGEHTFTLFVDGQEVASHAIIVSGTGENYLRGLEALYKLSDFPSDGDTTTVQWSQSAQDFTIIDVERK